MLLYLNNNTSSSNKKLKRGTILPVSLIIYLFHIIRNAIYALKKEKNDRFCF